MDSVARVVYLALIFQQDIRRSRPAFGGKILLYRAHENWILIFHSEALDVAAFVAAHSPISYFVFAAVTAVDRL